MMEQLVVRLGSEVTDSVHWLVWSHQQNEIIASGELPDATMLNTLSERVGQRPITALVPSSDILMTTVNLPAKASRKADTVVPYMLEDDLCADISAQFFAFGSRHQEDQEVAVVANSKMDTWLSWLSDAGLVCNKLLPDTLAVPEQDSGWSLLALGKQLLVRQGKWLGLQGETSWLLDAVTLQAKQIPEGLQATCYGELDMSLTANIHHQTDDQDLPMLSLAKGALASKFNLLQGQYKLKAKNTGNLQQWRWAIGLAVVALLISFVDKGIELNKLSAKKEQLREQVHAEYARAFPNAGKARNVRREMERRLKALGGGNASSSALSILMQLSPAFAESDVKPQTLNYDANRNELRVMAEADNYESILQFKRIAEQQGVTVSEGAINNRDNLVIGSLIIKG